MRIMTERGRSTGKQAGNNPGCPGVIISIPRKTSEGEAMGARRSAVARLWLTDRWRDLRMLFWRAVPHRPRWLWEDDIWCTFCERDHERKDKEKTP